jgi:glycosyltransferase involved in cell wall biosynthesis
MRPFTVLHTIETSGLGGAENVLLNIASRVDRERYRPLALVPRKGLLQDALEANGIRTHVIASRRWWDLRLPTGIARLCRENAVDLIHSHLPDQNFYSCLGGRLAGSRTLATFHGPVEFRNARAPKERLKLGVVRSQATHVVAVCDVVRQLLRQFGFAENRLSRIYNGVDREKYAHASPAGLRAQFGWPASTRLVGMVANVRISKGYDHFVRAARRVLEVAPDVRFVAAGDIDPVLGEPILALVKELGLEDRVKFLGFRSDVPAVLRDLDVFVLSSTSEGFPLVLLEAMAAGKSVVATRCGGPEEIVRDGDNGFLVQPGDDDALARRMLDLLANSPAALRMREAARATVDGFTIEGMIREYEALYERLR